MKVDIEIRIALALKGDDPTFGRGTTSRIRAERAESACHLLDVIMYGDSLLEFPN